MDDTGFSEAEIHMLYRRFTSLDHDKDGLITAEDLLQIQDFCLNPLAHRIIFAMFREQDHDVKRTLTVQQELSDPTRNVALENIMIPFESFVRTFARFRVYHDAQVDVQTYKMKSHFSDPNEQDVKTCLPAEASDQTETVINVTKKQDDWKSRLCSPKGKAKFIFRIFDMRGEGTISYSDVFKVVNLIFPNLDQQDAIKCSENFFFEGRPPHKKERRPVLQMPFNDFFHRHDIFHLFREIYIRFMQ